MLSFHCLIYHNIFERDKRGWPGLPDLVIYPEILGNFEVDGIFLGIYFLVGLLAYTAFSD